MCLGLDTQPHQHHPMDTWFHGAICGHCFFHQYFHLTTMNQESQTGSYQLPTFLQDTAVILLTARRLPPRSPPPLSQTGSTEGMTPCLHHSTRGVRPDLKHGITPHSWVTLGKLLLASVSLSFCLHKMGRTSTCLIRLFFFILFF